MPGHGVRVLIADDDEHVREAISDRLEHFGVVVVQASDGLAALAASESWRVAPVWKPSRLISNWK